MSRAVPDTDDDQPLERDEPARSETTARTYSSGDAARLLGMSRRQLHLYVRRGEVTALRTPGGHLRFPRVSLVRTCRRLARPIPEAVAGFPGQLLVIADDDRHAWQLGARTATRGLVDAAMLLSHGEYELVVIDLAPELASRLDLVRALRSFSRTADVGILGVGEREVDRGEFVRAGGDLGVSSWSDAPDAAAFLLGIAPMRLKPFDPALSFSDPEAASGCRPMPQRVP